MNQKALTHSTEVHGCLLRWSEDNSVANVYRDGKLIESFADPGNAKKNTALHRAMICAKNYKASEPEQEKPDQPTKPTPKKKKE